MDSMWRRTMLYLGLGPDDEYEEYDQDVDGGSSVGRSAMPVRETVPTASTSRTSAPPTRSRSMSSNPPPPVLTREPYETSAVRPLPTKTSDEPVAKPRGVVRPVPPTAKPFLIAPRTFNQSQEIADKFKAAQPVIVNLQGADRELARRLLDFLAGLCYGLGGQMEKVAQQVYMLTPNNVEVSAEERGRLKERGFREA
ncbi:MAG: cell division protein SepF [Actinomycetes bacterium]